MSERIYAVNPVSLGFFGRNLRKYLDISLEAGFFGLQLLPLKSWKLEKIIWIQSERVVSFEGAWNCGSLSDAFFRHFCQFYLKVFGADPNRNLEKFPTFKDWILFGNRGKVSERVNFFKLLFFNAHYVWHDVGWLADINRGFPILSVVVEFNPEVNYSELKWIRSKFGLCWDTEHILRPGRYGEPPVTQNWRSFLDEIDPERIKIIHVKTNKGSFGNASGQKELKEMLWALAEKTRQTKCPVVLEDRPEWRNVWSRRKTVAWLKKKRMFLELFFGE